MGSPQPFFRRAVAVAVAAVLPASLVAFATASTAAADPANPTPVSSTALPTAQVNGVVWSQVVSNGIDYVGGSFTQSQPAGAADGVDVTPRSNLFAYDVASGNAVGGFNATANAQVRGIAASADGSRIYIVGDFTSVNGVARSHVAALDGQGNLLPDFAPKVNGAVYAVSVRGAQVYIGGAFTAVNGAVRNRAAEVSSTGDLQPFAPNVASYVVRAIAASPDSTKVLLGGSFDSLNGAAVHGLAAVNATGATIPWPTASVVQDSGTNAAIFSMSTRGDVVYATGYTYNGAGNFEGTVAMNWSDGTVKWLEDCHGDSYSSVAFNDAVYTASHAHFCKNIGGFDQSDPETWHRGLAFSQAATGVVQHNTQPNYWDFFGQPAPTLLDWYPSFNTGTYTGSDQGPWSVAAGGSYVVYGGEFTKVNGARQTGLVRFLGQPESSDPAANPPATTPTSPTTPTTPTTPPAQAASKPHSVAKPDVVALGQTRVGVKWAASSAAKTDKVTGYVVSAIKGSKSVARRTVSASARTVVLTGLKKGTTYKITVTATNKAGSAKASSAAMVKTTKSGPNLSSTKKPTKVGKPSLRASVNSVRIGWKAASVKGATAVRHYVIRVYAAGKLVKTLTTSSGARSLAIRKLKAHTRYSVSVTASNWAGSGAASSKAAITTKH